MNGSIGSHDGRKQATDDICFNDIYGLRVKVSMILIKKHSNESKRKATAQ